MKNWEIQIDGAVHQIKYGKTAFRNLITIDGETIKVKSSNFCLNIVDYSFNFGNTQCNLVVIGNKVRLAVNGVYLDDNEPYEPINNIPSYVWVFVGFSVIGGFFLFGLIGMVIGFLMSNLYVNLGLKRKTGAVVGTFLGCTCLQAFVSIAAAILLF